MCPDFFSIGPFAIRAYGLGMAVAFFVGLWILQREAKKLGADPQRLTTMGYVAIISGIIGARVAYVAFHWEDFAGAPLDAINPFANPAQFGIAGLNLYGGVALALVAVVAYLLWRRIDLLTGLDAIAPGVAFGIFIARIGCFLNGCCFGTPTDLPWGLGFPEGTPPYYVFGTAPLHPAQLYSSAYGLILYFILARINARPHFAGRTIGVFLIAESIVRFAIEYVRYYETEMIFHVGSLNPTWNQIIGVALFAAGVAFFVVGHGRARQKVTA